MNNTPKPQAPIQLRTMAAGSDIVHVTCPRWGTQQAVIATVAQSTSFVRYLCKNQDCWGSYHLYALNPSVRKMMETKQAQQQTVDYDDEEATTPSKKRKRASKKDMMK